MNPIFEITNFYIKISNVIESKKRYEEHSVFRINIHQKKKKKKIKLYEYRIKGEKKMLNKNFAQKVESESLPETGGWNLSAVDKQH